MIWYILRNGNKEIKVYTQEESEQLQEQGYQLMDVVDITAISKAKG